MKISCMCTFKYVLYYFEILEMKINLEARKNLERSVSSEKDTYKSIKISCVICMQIFVFLTFLAFISNPITLKFLW
jgi:hypothetical protein